MCGIAGIWNRSGQPVDKSQIESMTRVLSHRGPDGQGIELLGDIAMGHRRLSIIDLSAAAHQPMALPDRSLWITYNGEIHNYLELRAQLESRGVAFRSESDTEVVLWAYKTWGAECFERFNGMWAMALWEPGTRRLTLSRDRFGIKPLHYSVAGDRVAFGSEAKAILTAFPGEARPNWQTAYEFMAGGWPQADDNTFFENIRSVPPAHNLVLDQASMSQQKYWRFEPGQGSTRAAATGELMNLLDDAVKLRLRSDVPVAVCLSGGLDSSAITRSVNRQSGGLLDCYSLQYADKRIDESNFAQMVADDATRYRMNWVHPRTDDFVGTLGKIVWHYDAPSAIRGKYPKWHVMEEAGRKEKVLLGGHGADEILGGYGHFLLPYLLDSFLDVSAGSRPARLGRLLHMMRQLSRTRDGLYRTLANSVKNLGKQRVAPDGWPWRRLLSPDVRRRYPGPALGRTRNAWYFAPGPEGLDSRFDSALWFETTSVGLPESLHAEDATSMAFGIESRLPFLDHRIVEHCFSLPFHEKLKNGWTKWPLREGGTDPLPDEIRWRRKKMGYPGAYVKWMTEAHTLPIARDIVVNGPVADAGFLDQKRLSALGSSLKTFAAFVKRDPERAWRLLTFQTWYGQKISGNDS